MPSKKVAKGKLKQPKSPMPPQHQPKPGVEAKITPKPRYEVLTLLGGETTEA
jgi:hypothetical protein